MTILSFSFGNVDAFKDQAEVSLRLTERDAAHGWTRNTNSGKRLTTLLAVVGANAAGKTSVLRALSFLLRFIRDSFHNPVNKPLGFAPFAGAMFGVPSTFKIEFEDIEGVYWIYELSCTSIAVISERLRRKEPGARLKRVFSRELVGEAPKRPSLAEALLPEPFAFEATYTIEREGLPAKLPTDALTHMRANVSLISFARQFGVNVLQERLLESPLVDALVSEGRASSPALVAEAVQHMYRSDSTLQTVKSYLRRWDLGLEDIGIIGPKPDKADSVSAAQPTKLIAIGWHRAAGSPFPLLFEQESSGTRAAFVLLRHMLQALSGGGVALIDELDATLHPHMIEPILRLFSDEKTNPHGAQLLCTLQNAHALSLLVPAQVLLVEKVDGVSSAYRADDVEGLKSEHNLQRRYMSGALGAVPQL